MLQVDEIAIIDDSEGIPSCSKDNISKETPNRGNQVKKNLNYGELVNLLMRIQ